MNDYFVVDSMTDDDCHYGDDGMRWKKMVTDDGEGDDDPKGVKSDDRKVDDLPIHWKMLQHSRS